MRYTSSLLVTVLLCLFSTLHSAKILSVFPFPGPSQYIFGSALLKALAERGHEVTSVSTFPQKAAIKNFRDVPVLDNLNLFDSMLNDAADGKEEKPTLQEFVELCTIGLTATTNVLENTQFKALLDKEKFDLVIMEVLVSEALLGLGERLGVPLIAVSTFGSTSFLDYLVGNPSPLSYVPNMGLSLDNHVSLRNRLENVFLGLMDKLAWDFFILPKQEKLYQKYFPQATMTLDEARKNTSIVLLNSHFTLNFPRPFVPNMIEVGGLHIKQHPDPLPQSLQKVLDDATHGAIYFSMGSNLKSKDLPDDKLEMFMQVFRELKVQVLWKFESENLPNKPKNVFIQKWYPQPSILAHPNVKMFISHGGFLSTTEAIFHAKPILGIPMFGDQFMNVQNAIKGGYALSLHFKTMTKESFKSAIEELLSNVTYTQTVQQLSQKYRDQPMTPMETAIYWVEYVIRHKGATHMRNAGITLNFWQYNNIDAFAIILAGLIIMAIVIYVLLIFIKMILKMITKRIRRTKKVKSKKR